MFKQNNKPLGTKKVPIFKDIPISILILVSFLVFIEGFLQISDESYRLTGIYLFGFWSALLSANSSELYRGQQIFMFFSHAFVHGDFSHMLLNSVIILALGKHLSKQLGSINVIGLFVISAVAGAGMFSLISYSELPMIGSSGGAFGFFGYWKSQEYFYRRQLGLSISPIIKFVIMLIIMHLILELIFGSNLAWQSHLGGSIMGVVYSTLVTIVKIFEKSR